MKILVLGRTGQLATSLHRRGSKRSGLAMQFAGRAELDLNRPGMARARILADRPDLVINAAAYTAVDKAESEPDAAMRLNADAPAEAAAAAREIGAGFVHVSTDYVFDGTGDRPWREADPVAPQNAYGRTKLAGEEQVRAAHPGALILRTAWVYGPTPPNFVNTMLRLANSRSELKIVDDQHGCPTHSDDLADVILALAGRWDEAAGLVLHAAGSEVTSWAGFARGIFAASAALGGPSATVIPCTSAEFAAPASRPSNSRLSGDLLEKRFGLVVPGWTKRIDETVAALLAAMAWEGQASSP